MFSDSRSATQSKSRLGLESNRFHDLPTTSRWQQAAAVTLLLSLLSSSQVAAEAPSALTTLIQNSCIDCHDENTETRLDFTELDQNFTDANTFRAWVKIVDRIQKEEMPPASEPRPDSQTEAAALTFLNTKLLDANRHLQKTSGRVPSRRLSRVEYEHTLHDLLHRRRSRTARCRA